MDNRNRYLYKIKINDELAFEGYLLHDEAWSCLKLKGQVSVSYQYDKIKKETDHQFKDFFKNNIT